MLRTEIMKSVECGVRTDVDIPVFNSGVFWASLFKLDIWKKKKWNWAPKGTWWKKYEIGGKIKFHCSLVKGLNSPGKLPSLTNLLLFHSKKAQKYSFSFYLVLFPSQHKYKSFSRKCKSFAREASSHLFFHHSLFRSSVKWVKINLKNILLKKN